MKTQKATASFVGYSMLLCLQAINGAEIPKLFNNVALNLPGSWSGGVVPGSGDVALWNELFASTVTNTGALSPLGADLAVQGIKVGAVGGSRNLATNYVGYHNPSSTLTLTIGAGGFDGSAATQTFFGSSKVTLGADQTWNVSNANTNGNPAGFNNNEDLVFIAQTIGAPFNFGGRTLTTTGAGQITLSSGYTVSNGTLNVGNNFFVIQGGSSRTTTLAADLNLVVNAGTLRLQSNSGASGVSLNSAAPATVNGGALEFRTNNDSFALNQSGAITLNNGSTLSVILDSASLNSFTGPIAVNGATTLRSTGGGNPAAGTPISGAISGAGTITYQNVATGTNGHINLTGDNSGFTGSLDVNGASGNRRLRLGSATAGSAAASWNVAAGNTLQVHGTTVQLGTLTGAGSVTNSSTTAPAALSIGAGLFSGVISDGTSQPTQLTKTGPGKLVLSGPNTYTGLTTVSGGQLVVPTTQTPPTPGSFTVADGANLTVGQSLADTTLLANQITLGTSTGATLEIGLGSQANPFFAPLNVTNLLVNGAGTLRVSGTNLSVGSFPVVEYGTLGGTSGFGGLTLRLPARTTGTLNNSAGLLTVNISQTQQIKWVGNVSDNWDIDPDGTQTAGTPNWKTTVTNTATRYLQGSAGTDVVTFDDTATGSGNVVLTTVLSPAGLTVNNTGKSYTFTGPGKLTGTTGLVKSGTGMLTLANATPNDYLGDTVIHAGTLRLGDGATVGAGIITGNIVNNGRLVLNRPADHAFTNALSGTGTLEKAAANTVTIGNFNFANPIVLTAGKLAFNNGGSLSGPVSGPGQLEAAGGTLSLDGADPNTNTGLVTVSAGNLRLNKTSDIAAVGGNVTIQGTGTLTLVNNEQIPDTATLTVLGSSTDSLVGSTGTETIANAVVNGSVPETQLILRHFAVITGTATVTQGILGVGSSYTASIGSIVMNSPTAIVRISGNTGGSILNVGAGGITASAGEIQVKFNTNNQDAVINLEGGLTTTGNLAITNSGYTGTSLNVINLLDGSHTFNIGGGTTTTNAADLGGPGALVKSGAGTLTLGPTSAAAHTGGTTVSQGPLIVNGTLAGTTSVAAGGTIGGTGSLDGPTTVLGTLAPGVATGRLTTTAPITLAGGSTLAIDVASWTGTTSGTDWDQLAANTLNLTATPASKLTIRVAGSPANFTETGKTMVIATSVTPISGFNPAAVTVDSSGFSGAGTWAVQQTGNTLELVYTAGSGSAYSQWAAANGLDASNNAPGLDPDKDGAANFVEFAFNGNPLAATASGKSRVRIGTVGAEQALTLTIPVRSNAAFTGATEQTLTVDGLTYRIQGSDALNVWDLPVTEVTGADAAAIQSGLPALQGGWFYRTFRSPGPIVGDPADFLRARIDFSN